MAETLISGKELLDNFFADISNLEGVDLEITNQLKSLYETDKLSEKNIVNFLNELRSK
jgi:hypothetical protein